MPRVGEIHPGLHARHPGAGRAATGPATTAPSGLHSVRCSRQALPGGGDFWGGCDARSGGGRACALRELTRRKCLSGESFGERSEFLRRRPRAEQRSAVGAKRRPPQYEPPPGTACRDAHRTDRRVRNSVSACCSPFVINSPERWARSAHPTPKQPGPRSSRPCEPAQPSFRRLRPASLRCVPDRGSGSAAAGRDSRSPAACGCRG